ncbi:MAG TPA: tetratricopeptide repeat protein [Polyangia bacterium]|jgi:hypothetical protein|nr:tetratricopeptide repeat protein [Polyangia bacterium]
MSIPPKVTSSAIDEYLERLERDPVAGPILRSGDRLRLYEWLRGRQESATDRQERRLLAALLAERRRFLVVLPKRPRARSVLGTGIRFLGAEDPEARDQSAIVTLYLSVLYLPLLPLSQYLARTAALGQREILGKVPLAPRLRWWQRGLIVIALAATSLAVVSSRVSSQAVRFVNGLDIPVRVSLGRGNEFFVAAQGRVPRPLARGSYPVTVSTREGVVVDQDTIEIPAQAGAIVYNILGAAPLYAERLVPPAAPGATAASTSAPPVVEQYAGQRFITRPGAGYLFEAPPEEVAGPRAGERRGWHLDVAPGGWPTTLQVLAADRLPEAAALAERIYRAEPSFEPAMQYASYFIGEARGPEALLEFARGVVAQHPDSVEAHRVYQQAMLLVGRHAECLAEYRAAHARTPDSSMMGYLRGRLERPAEALPLLGDLVKRFPEDPNLRRALAALLLEQRQFAEALPHFMKYQALAPQDRRPVLEPLARALVATGRAAEAAREVRQFIDDQAVGDPELSVLYARVARLAGDEAPLPPDHYFGDAGDARRYPNRLWFTCLVEGQAASPEALSSVGDARLRALLDLECAAWRDLDRALAMVRKAPTELVNQLDSSVVLLLAGELARRGDMQAAGRLLDHLTDLSLDRAALKAHVVASGKPVDPDDLDLEYQAALALIAGRRVASPAERARLYQAARRDDILRGPVTLALEHWPLP